MSLFCVTIYRIVAQLALCEKISVSKSKLGSLISNLFLFGLLAISLSRRKYVDKFGKLKKNSILANILKKMNSYYGLKLILVHPVCI